MTAALILMTMLATNSRADEQTEITFHAGRMTLNTGKASAGGGGAMSGTAYGVRYLHSATAFTAVGVDVDFLRPATKNSDSLIANARTTLGVESSSVLAVVRCGNTEEKIRPYGLFGMGVHFTTIHLEAAPQAGFGWSDTLTAEKRTLISSGGTAMAIKISGGADYAVNENFLAGLFLAFNHMGSATYAATDQAKSLGVQSASGSMTAITFGLNLTGRF